MSVSRPELYCEIRSSRLRESASSSRVFRTHEFVFGTVAAALLMLSASRCAWAKDRAPDWVHEAAAQTLPTYPAETKAVVLLDDTTLTVDTNGKAVEHVRRVIKILRPQGREEGVVHVEFDNDTKILSMTAWNISPNGQEDVIKEKEMSDVGLPNSGPLYEDIKFRVAQPHSDDPGSVVKRTDTP